MNNAVELKQPPRGDYGLLPLPESPLSNTYAANAAEFKTGVSNESNYDVILDKGHYAKSATDFKVSQELTYSKIED
jgi:hypothetical protein